MKQIAVGINTSSGIFDKFHADFIEIDASNDKREDKASQEQLGKLDLVRQIIAYGLFNSPTANKLQQLGSSLMGLGLMKVMGSKAPKTIKQLAAGAIYLQIPQTLMQIIGIAVTQSLSKWLRTFATNLFKDGIIKGLINPAKGMFGSLGSVFMRMLPMMTNPFVIGGALIIAGIAATIAGINAHRKKMKENDAKIDSDPRLSKDQKEREKLKAHTASGARAGIAGGALTGAGIGAIVGSIIPGVGTAIGAVVGGLIGLIAGPLIGAIVGGWKHFGILGKDIKAGFSKGLQIVGDKITQGARWASEHKDQLLSVLKPISKVLLTILEMSLPFFALFKMLYNAVSKFFNKNKDDNSDTGDGIPLGEKILHPIRTKKESEMAKQLGSGYVNLRQLGLKGSISSGSFRRCLDMNDRSLRNIYTKDRHGNLIETGFDITPASEIMAIFCLATDMDDLRRRIDNIIIAECNDGSFMYCSMLGITGSIVALLSEAIKPNLVQSLEHNPVIIHGGPFANIAHGCNTVLATKMGLSLADIVVTEAGFGSDLGAEKFWDIKCRTAGLKPDVVVLVVTIRGIKNQGGSISLENEDFTAFNIGLQNLKQHVNNLRKQGHKVIVTNNSFDTDTEKEQDALETYCMKELGVKCIKNTCFASGGLGAVKLACAVDDLIHETETTQSFVYNLCDPIKTKINKIAANVYGLNTANISYSKQAEKFIREHADDKFSNYPICIAKTQYSFADDPNVVLPVPTKDTPFHIDEIKINNGAEFLVVIAGEMMRMPGLPKKPAAMTIDYKDGEIIGLS